MKQIISLLLFAFVALSLFAQEEIVFTGIPEIKIIEGGVDRSSIKVSPDKLMEFKCIITKIDDKYFWTTRENVELVAISSGAYLTFLALNGTGYVRIINPEMKNTAALVDVTAEKFDYIEHLLLGLKSVTYYGKSK